jgi:hypothetical protein
MPTEPDYRELLQKAQQCTDEVREFLVAVCNAPQAKTNDAILSAAALTIEQVRIIEGQISGIWDMFQQIASATHEPSLRDPAPPTQPRDDEDDEKDKSIPLSWPE